MYVLPYSMVSARIEKLSSFNKTVDANGKVHLMPVFVGSTGISTVQNRN